MTRSRIKKNLADPETKGMQRIQRKEKEKEKEEMGWR